MTTATETDICWRLITAQGEDYNDGDGVPHFQAEQDADGEDLDSIMTPTRFASPCVTMFCDKCGVDLGGGDRFTQIHLGSVAEAHDMARASDWIVLPDGRSYCWDCPVPEAVPSDA